MACVPWLPPGYTAPFFATRISPRKDIDLSGMLRRCFDVKIALVGWVQMHMCLSIGGYSFKEERRIYRGVGDYNEYRTVGGDCRYIELAAVSCRGSKMQPCIYFPGYKFKD